MNKKYNELEAWINLRPHLNNKYNYCEKWSEAITIFNKRIQSKYFKPIQSLINQRNGEGFSIVTIQCALIESFAAFREGCIHNPNKPEIGGLSYEYKASQELFVRFLNSATIFKGIFFNINREGQTINGPFATSRFYTQVRCGLMHEARTKGEWYINACKNDNPKDKKFIKQAKKGNIIYRTLLQFALEEYFEQYKLALMFNSDESNELRRLFARKLDHLYDIKDDFEWWI